MGTVRMRTLIYVLMMVAVAFALLLFDDVEVGLSVLSVTVWMIVSAVGILLFARFHRRSRRIVRRRSRGNPRRIRHREIALKSQSPVITQR